jgi:hypothetical protein
MEKERATRTRQAISSRRNTNHCFPEMGCHHPLHHTGYTRSDSVGTSVHLPVEVNQPDSEGQGRKRIQIADCGTDARK